MSAGPRTLVHGDLVAHNVFVRDSPDDDARVIAIDWEKAGWGSPAEDLSGVDLESYVRAASELGAGPAGCDLEPLALAGRFFRCVVFLDWVVPRLDLEAGGEPLEDLASCCAWFDALEEQTGW